MSPFNVAGKTILVTGASSGIGRAAAICIAQAGGQLVLTARNSEALAETSGLCSGTGHLVLPADLTDIGQMESLCQQLPELDGMLHCAGVAHVLPIKFLTAEKVAETHNLNFAAPALLCAKLLKLGKLKKGASLVFVSSVAAQHPYKGGALYAASKAAVEAFAKTLALETAHRQMRANCIAPAMVQTPMMEGSRQAVSSKKMSEHLAEYPLGVGFPKDVAQAALFLLSEASSWITGQVLLLDGGLTLGA